MKPENDKAMSIDELLRRLEHVEKRELQTDSRENVRYELQRMQRNISAILAFVSYVPKEEKKINPELARALAEVRRTGLAINGGISRELLVLAVPFRPAILARHSNRITGQYERLMEAAHRMCLLLAPAHAQELLRAM